MANPGPRRPLSSICTGAGRSPAPTPSAAPERWASMPLIYGRALAWPSVNGSAERRDPVIGNLVTMLRCRERSNATTIRRGAGRTFRTPDGARRIRPADLGSAWQETLISALGRLDYTPQAARQALARSIADGWLRAERRERRSRVLLTPGTSTMLTSGAERIYSFGRSWDWDGQWLLVVLRVPEQSRHVRHRIRSQLAWAGFGSLGGGVYLSPHVEREAELRTLADDNSAAELQSFHARFGGGWATRGHRGQRLGPRCRRPDIRPVHRAF